ncbi:DUF6603 domain-containing protein [Pseudomonas batumici]|uniref:DUF6603 domain-containing protein n=1 Tax=Pseudomonas batumici TaxID=226910 RepID=UPI0030CCFB10
MTAMNAVSQDLSQLQALLKQKIDAGGSLVLSAGTTGITALDTLFGTCEVTLASASINDPGSDWPRSFTLSGSPSGNWLLNGLGANAAISQLTLTFTQTAQSQPVSASLSSVASVTVGQSVIGLSGSLNDDAALVLQLSQPNSHLPLLAVGNFAFSNRFGGWLPADLPLFTDMPFSQIQVQARYDSDSDTQCSVTTGVNGDWSLVQGGPSLTGAWVTLTSDTKTEIDQTITSLSASIGGSLLIGGQPWSVSVTLNGSSLVTIAVSANDNRQPALAALAGLIAGDAAAATVTEAVAKLPLANLVLNDVQIAFDWQQRQLLAASVAATLPFTFNKVPADLLLAVSVPPLQLGGGLSPKTPVKIRDVVIEYLGDATGFPDTVVTQLAFDTVPSEGSYSFSLGMQDVFSAGPLALNTVSLKIDKSADATTGSMSAALTLGGVDILVEAGYDKGWQIAGSTAYGQTIAIGQLISDVASKFNVTCPAALSEFTLQNLAASLDTSTSKFTFACQGSFPIAGTPLDFSINLELSKPDTRWQGNFNGSVVIGPATFKVTFTQDAKVKLLRAELVPTPGKTLLLTDLAQTFSVDLSGVPAELLPQLTMASFTYDFNKSQLVFTASTDKVAVSLVSVPTDKAGRIYAAVVDIAVEADISQLPVVGDTLSSIQQIGLDGMSLVIASGLFTPDEITAVNAVIPSGQPQVPALSAEGRVVLSANLMLGGKAAKPLQLAFAQPSKPKPALLGDAPAANAPLGAPTPAGTAKAQGKWVNVQKSFGPISLSRVGVAYREQRVWLMLDGGFAMGGIEIDLMGASIAFRPVLPPIPDGASLDGLFVGFSNDAVSISGGLLKVVTEDDKGNELIEYDGQLMLKVPQFQLSALGSYASLNGSPSLFAYAVLAAPIGGPPFLQVDAVAAGFGFNRDLIIPGLDKLGQMPLIAAVNGGSPFAGKDAAQALKVMHDYVPPSYGEYFIAVGVRAASFQMIKGFLLATGKLGNEFEVALLGLATVSVPPNTSSPIGYAELVLKADYNFNRGTLFLGAQLTTNSFILSKDCHLTGGFAVAAWTKDNPDNPYGYKAGDFVVSLGGYHPAFSKPDWYPDVPRLGFNWNVTSELTVKGGLYFALVPSAVMAGGSLEAVWQSGDLRAWFKAWVDFLLGWKPFHYDADIGISLGASYKVDLGITSFTVSVHVGVQIHLWGPDFAGTATADLYVISITISFGASNNNEIKPIQWSDFKSSFLPGGGSAPKNQPHELLLAALPSNLGDSTPIQRTDSVCLVRVANGLLKDLAGQDGMDWVLDPERFQLTTWCALPSKQASYTGSGAQQDISAQNTAFGVGPVGVSDSDFVSTHTVVISKLNGEMSAEDIRVDVSPVQENLPSATWSTSMALDPSLSNLNDPQKRAIPDALTGLSITAKKDNPDVTPLPIDLKVLREELGDPRSVFWPTPTVPTATGYDEDDTMPVFTKALTDIKVDATRSAILAQLADAGLSVSSRINVSALAQHAADTLLHAPVLSVLGAQPVSSPSGAARP